MKTKLIAFLILLTAFGVNVNAQRVKFAVGLDGSTPATKMKIDKYYVNTPVQIWEIGVQGEARIALSRILSANSILNINYDCHKMLYPHAWQGNSRVDYLPYRFNGVAFKFTEYFNFNILKGWSVGTGPAVRYTTNKFFSGIENDYPYAIDNKYRWTTYWVFGIGKEFGRITARITWQQKMINTEYYSNMLNFQVLYSF